VASSACSRTGRSCRRSLCCQRFPSLPARLPFTSAASISSGARQQDRLPANCHGHRAVDAVVSGPMWEPLTRSFFCRTNGVGSTVCSAGLTVRDSLSGRLGLPPVGCRLRRSVRRPFVPSRPAALHGPAVPAAGGQRPRSATPSVAMPKCRPTTPPPRHQCHRRRQRRRPTPACSSQKSRRLHKSLAAYHHHKPATWNSFIHYLPPPQATLPAR